jgi:hypothetical protein
MINRATKSQVRAGRMNPRLACDTIILHGKSTWSKREKKIIEIQRSCEHGGLCPLDPYISLVSRRTGLFYNIKEGG